jgi:DNA-binding PadR family transcriptional regulator
MTKLRIRTTTGEFGEDEESLYPAHYAALQRLIKAGLVETSWKRSDAGGWVRIYRLTPAGARRADDVRGFE